MTLTITSAPPTDSTDPDPSVGDLFGGDDPGPVSAAERLLTGFGSTAQTLFAGFGRRGTVRAVVELALPTFRCGGVGVVLVDTTSQPAAAGASDDDAASADRLQLSLRQGPALQAIDRRQPVLVNELRSDSRWRFWAPLAADLGLRSALALPLADGDITGSLTLYSRSAAHFRSSDLAPAMVYAQLASIAVAVAQEREQLLQALQSRSVVGQAQGILMKLHGVTATQALTVLHRYAAEQDMSLKMLAECVIQDRGLPDIDAQRPPSALRS